MTDIVSSTLLKLIAISLSADIIFMPSAYAQQKNKKTSEVAYGKKSDVVLAHDLWEALLQHRIVGVQRINVHAYKGKPPHGRIQQVYATAVTVQGHKGKVIVKANHTKKGVTVQGVYDHPNKYLSSYTVMFANKPGYDPENKNWFWVRYFASGEIARSNTGVVVAGRVGKIAKVGCIGCHKKLGGEDLEALTSK